MPSQIHRQRSEESVRWYNLDSKDIIARLETDRHRGLSLEKWRRRLTREGPHRLFAAAIVNACIGFVQKVRSLSP